MKFRPLHDRVVVRRVDSETKTSGGIIIPDTAAEKPQQGEIIAVGPGARDESGKIVPLDVKAKDKVLFGKWSGTEVKIDGQELLIMKESDIMGVLDRSNRAAGAVASGASLRRSTIDPTAILEAIHKFRSYSQWLPKTSNFPPMPASACCAASTFSPTP